MMYGVQCCSFARCLSSAAIKYQPLLYTYRTCLQFSKCNPSQKVDWKYHGNLHQTKTNLLSSLKQQTLYQKRCESSSSGDSINDGSVNSSGADLDVVREELTEMRTIGRNVPETISDSDLGYYATLTSKGGKRKFLNFLVKREGLRKREKLKKLQKSAERQNNLKDEDIEDTLPINRLLRRISDVTMLAHDNWRLASAMTFGPQIAFDFSFDDQMARPEIISMVSQLTHVLNANKTAADPFYMHWTGLKDGSATLTEMRRMIGGHFENLMVNVTDQDAMDVFPHDKLIYLTADSANIMHTFDADKVYVVGGLVDARTIQTGITLGKAKRYNINHARLPLDLYLQWETGAKTLTLDQVARILHTMHETQDWTEALKNVPMRKHGGFKMARQINKNVLEEINTRPELEKYYQRQKEAMHKGRERKETVSRDNARFSFSRAKREFKWDLSDSDVKKTQETSYFNEEMEEDYDPTSDTLFSSSEKVESNQQNRRGKKGSKWFQT